MSFFTGRFLSLSPLTFRKLNVLFNLFIIQLNRPIVLEKGVLSLGPERGIITLTLVISQVSIAPSVTRGRFMFGIFRVKTQFQLQIEEYINWKAKYSIYAAEIHKEVLLRFFDKFKYKNVAQVLKEDIQTFYLEVRRTQHGATKAMEAIRGFMRYLRKLHTIDPQEITNQGIIDLPSVPKTARIEPMRRRKLGRPPNVSFIESIQKIREASKNANGKYTLSIRDIARAKKSYPAVIHRAIHYKLPKMLAK